MRALRRAAATLGATAVAVMTGIGGAWAADTAAGSDDAPLIQPLSASGVEYFGNFSYAWEGISMKIPTCAFGHKIGGSGRKITSETTSVSGVGCDLPAVKFCNWRIDFAYADTNNKTYKTSKGKLHTTCNVAAGVHRANASQTLPHYGKACAKLYVAGKSRAVQCHNIVK